MGSPFEPVYLFAPFATLVILTQLGRSFRNTGTLFAYFAAQVNIAKSVSSVAKGANGSMQSDKNSKFSDVKIEALECCKRIKMRKSSVL